MEPYHLPDEALQYKDEWITLSVDLKRVVGHGKSVDEAMDMGYESGEEFPILFFMRAHPIPIIA